MSRPETPEAIAELRQVTADLVLSGRFLVAQYPFHNLSIMADRGFWYQQLAAALAAAEALGPAGFELVNVVHFDKHDCVCAVVRRR